MQGSISYALFAGKLCAIEISAATALSTQASRVINANGLKILSVTSAVLFTKLQRCAVSNIFFRLETRTETIAGRRRDAAARRESRRIPSAVLGRRRWREEKRTRERSIDFPRSYPPRWPRVTRVGACAREQSPATCVYALEAP